MEFPTLILGVSLFFAVLTDKDWFPTILVIIMSRGPDTKRSRVNGRVVSTPMALVHLLQDGLQNTLPIGRKEVSLQVYDYRQYQIWD